MYQEHIRNISGTYKCVWFADDTDMSYLNKNLDSVETIVNDGLEKNKWLVVYKQTIYIYIYISRNNSYDKIKTHMSDSIISV